MRLDNGQIEIIDDVMAEVYKRKIAQKLYIEAESIINHAMYICQSCNYRLYEPNIEISLDNVNITQGEKTKAKVFASLAYFKAERCATIVP